MPNKNGQKKKKRDVWLRGGEKERMHGESVGGSIIYDRTSKAKEELKEVHY